MLLPIPFVLMSHTDVVGVTLTYAKGGVVLRSCHSFPSYTARKPPSLYAGLAEHR